MRPRTTAHLRKLSRDLKCIKAIRPERNPFMRLIILLQLSWKRLHRILVVAWTKRLFKEYKVHGGPRQKALLIAKLPYAKDCSSRK